jgi:flagellar protein FlaG
MPISRIRRGILRHQGDTSMSIEAISSVVQPAMVKGDGLQNLKYQDAIMMSATNDSPVELPSSAVKSVSPAEEEEMLKDATDKANEFVKTMNQELQFSVDKDDGKTVVKVMDKNSGELIRQIPQDEMLAIAKAFDTLKGLIIREKV